MIWQDVVIGIGQFVFALALVPAIVSEEKPPRSTCAMTGGLLAVFAMVYATLDLWLATLACAICATCWLVLMIQKRRALGW